MADPVGCALGSEPLLYVTVLLLSLQFRAAVDFLAQDPGTKPYRVDAVHLGIALLHHQLLDVTGPDAGARGSGIMSEPACQPPAWWPCAQTGLFVCKTNPHEDTFSRLSHGEKLAELMSARGAPTSLCWRKRRRRLCCVARPPKVC